MEQTGRLFIAAELPDAVIRALELFSSELQQRTRGKFVSPDNYHVTLAFLGDTSLILVPEITALIQKAADRFCSIPVSLSQPGYFGKPGNAIYWYGIDHAAPLVHLAERLRQLLRLSGIRFDEKPVLPHITLARHIDSTRAGLLSSCRASGNVTHITLFHSTRIKGVLTYLPLARVPLSPPDP